MKGKLPIFAKRVVCENQLPFPSLQPHCSCGDSPHTPGAAGWCQVRQWDFVLHKFGVVYFGWSGGSERLAQMLALVFGSLGMQWHQLEDLKG